MAFSGGTFSLLYDWGQAATLSDRVHGGLLQEELAGIATGLTSLKWRAVSVSATDTASDLNGASWASAPLTGTTDLIDGDFFTVSGSGVEVANAGRYRLAATLHLASAAEGVLLEARVAVNGTPTGPTSTAWLHAWAGPEEASAQVVALFDLSAEDVVTVAVRRVSGANDAVTLAESGTSTFLIETWQ